MKPAFLALASAAALSVTFALIETLAFAAMFAVPALSADDAGAATSPALYRWTEADGSLTFAPTPPADGRPYTKVDPNASSGPAGIVDPSTRAATPAGAAPASADAPSVPDSGAIARSAPALGAAAIPSADDRSRAPAGASRADADAPEQATIDGQADSSSPLAGSDRERRCGELEKRVVSLERRLATPLTPTAMDDTVVRMAHYQRSVDRHCR